MAPQESEEGLSLDEAMADAAGDTVKAPSDDDPTAAPASTPDEPPAAEAPGDAELRDDEIASDDADSDMDKTP